ncbi:MAG: hypothetical protein Q8Q18_03400 [bacterium]|nr:hypothetical protein [bacterium]
MISEYGKFGTPEDSKWKAPKDDVEVSKEPEISTAVVEPLVQQKEKVAPVEETALVQIRLTEKNPIETMVIGLRQTMGQVDMPTRVVATLKDGQEISIPWEQAERMLPPEYKTARELGQRARRLERTANYLDIAIRVGTDVMEISGHIKNELLELIGRKTKAVQHLETIEDLISEISNIAQESFLELRRMTNARESHAPEINALSDKLDYCEKRLDQLRDDVFSNFENVQPHYEEYVSKKQRDERLQEEERRRDKRLAAPREPKE